MKKTILLLSCIFFSLLSFAQIGEHIYGTSRSDLIQQIVETSDGNILLLGTKEERYNLIWLQKIRPNGSIIWERTFLPDHGSDEIGYGLKLDADGHILIVGRAIKAGKPIGVFLKCTPDGKPILKKYYDFVTAFYDVEAIGDNFFLAGSDERTGVGIIIKTDKAGVSIKERTHFEELHFYFMKKILRADSPDKFYAFEVGLTPTGKTLLIKKFTTELEYSLVDEFKIDLPWQLTTFSDALHEPVAACLSKEGGIWVATSNEENETIQLFRYSPLGKLEKELFFNYFYQEFPRNILQLENGEFIISGNTPSRFSSPASSFIIRVDSTGKEIWRKHLINEQAKVHLFSQIQLKDKNLYFAGAISETFPIEPDGYLLKTDLDGNYRPVQINGKVVLDLNQNCIADPDEPGLSGWYIQTNNSTNSFIEVLETDTLGNFSMRSKNEGFTVFQLSLENRYETCQDRKAVLNDADLPIQEVTFLVSIENLPEPKTQFLVFPNPADDFVNISFFPFPTIPVDWEIHNVSGQLMTGGQTEYQSFAIEVRNFPTGMYFLSFPNSEYPTKRVWVID